MKNTIALLCLALLLTTCTKTDHTSLTLSNTSSTTPRAAAVATPFTTAYVEVNSNSIKNPGCYTYGSPAKQLFSFAVIFAANINYTNNQPALYFNPQVQTTLTSGNVAYLKSLGIKVLLDVLG